MDMPPVVELPRTFTERPGLGRALGYLLFGAIVYGGLAITPSATAAWRWGTLVCMSTLALISWFSAGTRRITCTEQGITVSTRRLLSELRQSACLWSDVTAMTYTYRPGIPGSAKGSGGSLPEGTFAVETSQGAAVMISDRSFAYFEEFVAICNAHTPQLPYIWEHRQRLPFRHQMRFPGGSMSFGPVRSMDEVWPPDYFQVPRDRGGP
jgi:hypothetical protein